MTRARLGCTRKLRQRHQRYIQLLRQTLKLTRNLRYLLLPRLETFRAASHQLKVVDDNQIQTLLFRSKTTSLGTHLEHGDAGGVVEEHFRICQSAERFRNLRPLRARKKSIAEALCVDIALRTEHAHH